MVNAEDFNRWKNGKLSEFFQYLKEEEEKPAPKSQPEPTTPQPTLFDFV